MVDLDLDFFWQIEDEGLSNGSCKDSHKKIYQETKGIQNSHNDMNQIVIRNLQRQMDQKAKCKTCILIWKKIGM